MLIALAQINTRAGDFSGVCARIVETALQAEEAGADLMLVSPVALSGTHSPDEAYWLPYVGDMAHAVSEATDLFDIPCLVPVFVDEEDRGAASLILMGKRRLDIIVTEPEDVVKRDPYQLRIPAHITRFAYQKIRFSVCYSFDDLASETARRRAQDAVILFSSARYALDDSSTLMGAGADLDEVKDLAQQDGVSVIGVNGVGGYESEIFSGGSFVVSAEGELCALCASHEEDLVLSDSAQWLKNEDVEAIEVDRDANELCWDSLVLGLSDYVHKRGLSDVALVIDGTMQSAALATLAVDALGPTHVHALLYGEGTRLADARSIANNLHLAPEECAVNEAWDIPAKDIVSSRLAALAQRSASIPLLPFDKTYLALEDEASHVIVDGLLPFGDIYRSVLSNLIAWRNERSQVIVQSALQAFETPVFEGLENVQGGSSQSAIDNILRSHVEEGDAWSAVCSRSPSPELARSVLERFEEVSLSRLSYPTCLATSTIMLSEIGRPPRGWRDHLRSSEEIERSHPEARKMSSFTHAAVRKTHERFQISEDQGLMPIPMDADGDFSAAPLNSNMPISSLMSLFSRLDNFIDTSTLITSLEISSGDDENDEEDGFYPYSEN